MSLNLAMLIGNLGADPEIRATQSGDRVANLSVATTERRKNKNTNEYEDQTTWHKVVVFGTQVEKLEAAAKGWRVSLCGRMQTRKWQDNSGQDRYITEVVISGFGPNAIIDVAPPAREQLPQRPTPAPTQTTRAPQRRPLQPVQNAPADLDDEIPF